MSVFFGVELVFNNSTSVLGARLAAICPQCGTSSRIEYGLDAPAESSAGASIFWDHSFLETAVLTSVQDAYEAIYTGRSYQHEMALVDVVLERRLGKWRSED